MRRGSRGVQVSDARHMGSSRRAPGQLGEHGAERVGAGFIPACAGAAETLVRLANVYRVHPGVRRGSRHLTSGGDPGEGSSRRAPGQRQNAFNDGGPRGFIPACAGAAVAACTIRSPTRVHPGVRRGSLAAKNNVTLDEGSSRRAPGQPGRQARGQLRHGFIPACAGAARCPAGAGPSAGVHPGVRRGSAFQPPAAVKRWGSSRRAPGQRDDDRGPERHGGFIPACAGAAR